MKQYHYEFGKFFEKSTWAAFLIAFHEYTRNFVQFGGKLTEKSLQQFWIIIHWIAFSKILLQTILRQFSTDLDEISYGGIESIEESGSALFFLIVSKIFRIFQKFPEIFLNWKVFNFFLQNSSRVAYLSRFSLSIRNFMLFGEKLRGKSLQRHLYFFLRPRL